MTENSSLLLSILSHYINTLEPGCVSNLGSQISAETAVISEYESFTSHLPSVITRNNIEVKKFLVDYKLHHKSEEELEDLILGANRTLSSLNFYLETKYQLIVDQARYKEYYDQLDHFLLNRELRLEPTKEQIEILNKHVQRNIGFLADDRSWKGPWIDFKNPRVAYNICREDIKSAKISLEYLQETLRNIESIKSYLNLTFDELVNELNKLPKPASDNLRSLMNSQQEKFSMITQADYIKRYNLASIEMLLREKRFSDLLYFSNFIKEQPAEANAIFRRYPIETVDFFRYKLEPHSPSIVRDHYAEFRNAFSKSR